MKKAFTAAGKFIGIPLKVIEKEDSVSFVLPGDFPGMEGKTVTYLDASVVFEDKETIYIDFH